jgi:hypothetical protein
LSDSVDLAIPDFADLAISLSLPLQRISNVSTHSGAQQTNYIQVGNEVSAPRLSAPQKNGSSFFIKGVDVLPVASQAAASQSASFTT